MTMISIIHIFAQLLFEHETIKVDRGYVSTNGWDPTSEILNLKGDWKLYWGQLLSPEDVTDNLPNEYIYLPGYWKWIKTSHGYCTIQLKIDVSNISNVDKFGIYIPYIYSSYNVFIDNQLVSSLTLHRDMKVRT